jgi:hypothetical protein
MLKSAAMRASAFVSFVLLSLAACGDSGTSADTTTSSSTGGGGTGGAGTGGAVSGSGGAGGSVDKAAGCVGTFGTALTNDFGRIDGTVLAVVKPTDTQCPMFNDDHVVLEVTMQGSVYRAVINVQSTFGDPNVRFLALDHALPGLGWQEGWHTGLTLDYVADFGVHAGPPFEPLSLTDLSDRIADEITIGEQVSVFCQSSGGPSSHEIHRNDGIVDGAIVLDPNGAAPKALLFHFGDQQF